MKISIKKTLIIMARKCIGDSDLVKLSSVPYSTWTQIKSRKASPTIATIGKIAKGLGVDVTEIIED